MLQSGFRFSDATDVWFPLDERADSEPAYRAQWYGVVARLKRGIAPDRAAAEVDRVGRNFAGAAPSDYPGFALQLRNSIVPRGGGQLLLVSSLVGLLTVMVFGIACTNVGNLIAVRAVERSGEMAVRAALGASPRRLLGMHLIEASMLAAGSGMLGAGFAWVGIRILVRAIRTGDLPSWLRFGLDIRVLLFACGITACTVLLIGLIPARRTLRTDLLDVLGSRAGGTLVTDRVARSARRSTVLQVSLALAAFVSAALLARSYLALQAFRHGYDAKGVLIATATGVFSHTTISEDNARSIAKVVLSNNSIDGVALAGPYVSGRASSGDSSSGRRATDVHLYLASQPTVPRDRDLRPTGKRLVVSDGYFALLHIPIVAGRAFGAEDVTGGGGVAVVSQRIATTLWPAENAVGQTFRMGVRGPTFTVVGVAGDVRDPTTDSDLGPSSAPWPHVYFPMSQAVFRPDLYVRSRASPATVRALIQSAANAVASNILVRDVQSLGQASASSTQFAQTMSLSVGTLAVGAGLLAIIGVYGVIAYGVALRRREIGLRIALGATPRNVVWLFTWRGARTIAIGIVVGLVLALATSAILAGLVWNVSPFDPLVYVASTGVFLLIGLLACWLPARRAASVQPVEAMRMV